MENNKNEKKVKNVETDKVVDLEKKKATSAVDTKKKKNKAVNTEPVRSVKQTIKKKKTARKPMTKKMKIILSCILSSVIVAGVIIGLCLGLAKKDVFNYLKLEVDSRSDTYSIVDVSPKLKGDVVIPKEYKGRKITLIADKAFYKSNVESLVLPDTITNFGYRAFADSKKLKSINTPDNLYIIGQECFYNCSSLKSFTVSDVTTTIGDSAFRNCTNLKNFELKSEVSSIGRGAFGYCKSLESIIITENVRSIRGPIFTYCDNLKEIKVDEANEKYSSLGSNCVIEVSTNTLISGCKTSVIPEGIVTIGDSAFEGIKYLPTIDIPLSLNEIGVCAFYGCEEIGSQNGGVLNLSSVATIGRLAFSKCESIEKVEIAGIVESLGTNVFASCTNIKEVNISSSSLKEIPINAFFNCALLETLNISAGVETIAAYAFTKCVSLKNVTLNDSLKEIQSNAFSGCTDLLNIYVPDSVEVMASYIFYDCNDNLVIKMQAASAKTGYESKFNYSSQTKQLTTEWGVAI